MTTTMAMNDTKTTSIPAENAEAEATEDPSLCTPVLLHVETGQPVFAEGETVTPTGFDPDALYAGNVLTFDTAEGKRHFLVHRVEPGATEFDPPRVYMAPGKSNLRKGFLLLAILAATWFLIDWLVHLFLPA